MQFNSHDKESKTKETKNLVYMRDRKIRYLSTDLVVLGSSPKQDIYIVIC